MFLLFILPLGLLATAFWIWMLIDAAKNRGLNNDERVIWVVVVALLHFLGAAIYFFAGRPKRKLVPPVHA
ncbi:MAG TPA: PLD nuclease N-terminal domain-containing protein [Candidatus Angelobacter sp.]|nr:PLD nuclease N-terminal domain-containing protein [Candidatus Angelobacter sp.]